MSIRLENISKYYGLQVVVNNLSLEVKDGEFFVLLGASGSGKTTVLNVIAGLIQPEKGKVLLHDRDVTNLLTQHRNVGFVFQNYALFQHMTVSQNIEFGLQVRKIPQEQRQRRKDELLEMVGLVGLGDRMPSQLSGGQQQRVALARALAPEPEVLLLDEPLGALDAKIRVELRRSLKKIQRRSGVAAILVTHDQEEAFDLGDRIGVMNFGRLIEVGSPEELYQYPKTEYVASFLGSANLLLGQIKGQEVFIGKRSFPLPDTTQNLRLDERAQILFRPEDIALASGFDDLGCLPLGKGEIVEKGFNGPDEHLRVALPAIEGVRSIAPSVPYGNPDFIMEVNRSAEQSTNLPMSIGSAVCVGIRRLHVLSHPGLNFLLVTDGSLRSQSAITMGGYMARMAHARVVMLGIGEESPKLEGNLQEARKQLGSGMAGLEVQTSPGPVSAAVSSAVERHLVDMVIMGWRLAMEPAARLSKALICLASGEPGKDTVNFAGRLLRHMGADATLLTVIPEDAVDDQPKNRVERFLAGGQNSLARFGVSSQAKIKSGALLSAVQEEMQQAEYDLVVLGAPLPDQQGQPGLGGAIGNIISSVENCSFLIVQSQLRRTP